MTTDDRLPAATHVGAVGLRVADIDRMVEFYHGVVGLSVLARSSDRVSLGVDGDRLLVLIAASETPSRPHGAAGLYHVAVRLPTRAHLGAALDRVRTHWSLNGAADHHVSEALYLDDPEGNGVELYWDRPRESWPTTADGGVRMDTLPLDIEALAAAGTDDRDAPAGTDIGHVHLEATSIPEAREFYVDTIGLSVRQAVGGSALFLAAGDYHHHLGVNTWRRRTDPAAGRGLAWYELVLPDETALTAARGRLDAADWPTTEAEQSIRTEDPDGIALRLVTPDTVTNRP